MFPLKKIFVENKLVWVKLDVGSLVYKGKHNKEQTKIRVFESTCEAYSTAVVSAGVFYCPFVRTECA